MINIRHLARLKAKIARLEAEIGRVEAGKAPRRVDFDTWQVRQTALRQRREKRNCKSWAVLFLLPFAPILATIGFLALLGTRGDPELPANAVYLVALKNKVVQLQTDVDRFEGDGEAEAKVDAGEAGRFERVAGRLPSLLVPGRRKAADEAAAAAAQAAAEAAAEAEAEAGKVGTLRRLASRALPSLLLPGQRKA